VEIHKNMTHEEMNRKLNSGDAFNHSVQRFLSSYLLSKNIKFEILSRVRMTIDGAWTGDCCLAAGVPCCSNCGWIILWPIDPLLSGDSVNNDRFWVTAR
jgi:hypothetical protein